METSLNSIEQTGIVNAIKDYLKRGFTRSRIRDLIGSVYEQLSYSEVTEWLERAED